jgi:HEAT repeat protein
VRFQPLFVFIGLLAVCECKALQLQTTSSDEDLLKQSGVETNSAGILGFFHQLSLTESQNDLLQAGIRALGSPVFKTRTTAANEIVASGLPALPSLRHVVQDPDIEVARRARICIEEIERRHPFSEALPMAAARILVARKPAGAVEALLAYLPFNENESVEQEALAALLALGVHDERVDPALRAALHSAQAVRRGAAAYVLGQCGDPKARAAVRDLLTDSDANVRFRAAQALVTSRDKSGVPTLIALLDGVPSSLSGKAEELLTRIAGERAPSFSAGPDDKARDKYQDAWATWWRDFGQKAELPHIDGIQQHLGLTLLAEIDSNKVWEYDRDGKVRWRIDHLQGPMDAQVLPGGHVLIAEYQGRRVTERDTQGKILWAKQLDGSPISCQRLSNGNTFIATHNRLLEVTKDGTEAYSRAPAPGLFVFSAQKLPNGHIVLIANPGLIQELDALTGKILRSIRLGNNFGGWCGVEVVPGGRFLVALFGAGKVLEIDGSGKTVWECNVASACHATRLPDGHTLVTSMMNQRVVEVDRNGKTVKTMTTAGRPWRVHQR